jgi:hypothetical protein
MSSKQIESSSVSNRARVFKSISVFFDSLPDHFKAGDLEKLAGFKPSPLHRMLVASVLTHDFKCRQVGAVGRTCWAKP